jgi:WhiB family redox-sensing transcriptional regulator
VNQSASTLPKHVKQCISCDTFIASAKHVPNYPNVQEHAARGQCRPCYRRGAAERLNVPTVPDTPPVNTRWRERANCRGLDTELFFPMPTEKAKWERAKRICGRCPVSLECLQDALHTASLEGVRGGLDAKQLDALFRANRRARKAAS